MNEDEQEELADDEEFDGDVGEEEKALIRKIRALIDKKGGEYGAVVYSTSEDSFVGVSHTCYTLLSYSGIQSESCTSDSFEENMEYVLEYGETDMWDYMDSAELRRYRDFLIGIEGP